MPIVQFTPFSSLVQPAFWHELTKLKIDVLRLSDDAQPVIGFYTAGRTINDRETGQEIALGSSFTVGVDSFAESARYVTFRGRFSLTLTRRRPPPGSITAIGTFKNYNTIEEFKMADKTALFNQETAKVFIDCNPFTRNLLTDRTDLE
jgi:ubiquitin-like modifier-activating enzyme ATG7